MAGGGAGGGAGEGPLGGAAGRGARALAAAAALGAAGVVAVAGLGQLAAGDFAGGTSRLSDRAAGAAGAALGPSAAVAVAQALDHGPYGAFFSACLVGHCLFTASLTRGLSHPAPGEKRDPSAFYSWLLSLVYGVVGSFGGGLASCLLLRDPSLANLAVFSDNRVLLFFVVAWWLMNCAPQDVAFKVYTFLPVQLLARMGSSYLRSTMICMRVDMAVAKFPGSVGAPLLLGTIGGTGGKFFSDFILGFAGRMPAGQLPEIMSPSFGGKASFLTALLYVMLVHWGGFASREAAEMLVVLCFELQTVGSLLSGQPCDFTLPVVKAFHALAGIPEPGLGRVEGSGAAGPKATRRSDRLRQKKDN